MPKPTNEAKARIEMVVAWAERLRISVPQLLAKAQVSPITWWRWESGRAMPSLDTMAKIERAAKGGR